MACCSACAQLGDVAASGSFTAERKRPMLVIALSLAGLAALLYLAPEKKRYRRRYADPGIRQTRELPAETMGEVVHQRRR